MGTTRHIYFLFLTLLLWFSYVAFVHLESDTGIYFFFKFFLKYTQFYIKKNQNNSSSFDLENISTGVLAVHILK